MNAEKIKAGTRVYLITDPTKFGSICDDRIVDNGYVKVKWDRCIHNKINHCSPVMVKAQYLDTDIPFEVDYSIMNAKLNDAFKAIKDCRDIVKNHKSNKKDFMKKKFNEKITSLLRILVSKEFYK